MGRVINYSIKKDKGTFSKKDFEVMQQVSEFYNSATLLNDINKAYNTELKEIWTCESFYIGIGANYYPNWSKPLNSWNNVNARIEQLEKSISKIDAIFQAKKEGIISYHDESFKTEMNGFTKVQGNEFNSLLVLKAIIEISKKIPTATVSISDEGEFLLCPLKIKNGKALPDIDDLLDSMQHYALKMLFSKEYKNNILNELATKDFDECFKSDLHIENTYGDMTNYINEKLRNLKEIETAIKRTLKHEAGNELYFYNIASRNSKDWFNPEIFTRTVNVEKFINYKLSAATMMDGFHGEGFSLTDKDSETESYKMISHILSALSNSGVNKENIKILGEN